MTKAKAKYLEAITGITENLDSALNELRIAHGEMLLIKKCEGMDIYLAKIASAIELVENMSDCLNNEIDELEDD